MAKIKKGDSVKWTSRPRGEKPFEASGKVRAVRATTFGSSRKGLGASVEVAKGSRYHKATGRTHTTVSVERLRKA